MKFEKDIFISYAHIDDESLIEGEKGWISEFHRSLEVRLSQLLGYRPKIWRDSSLDGNHDFSNEIIDQFPNIAVLVSILSPRYVNSEWCTREVNEFCKVSEQNIGLTVNNKARVFKVIKTPVEIENHPKPIQGMLGYEFYMLDPETNRVKEFSKLYGPETQQAYWARLDDIAYDITNLLNELKKTEGNNGSVDDKLDSSEIKEWVYLAETSFDRKDDRDTIRRMLQENGIGVLPDQNMPLIANEYNDSVKQMLAKSAMSIHILGNSYGLVPEGTESSKVKLQCEISAQHSSENGFQRLLWLPPDAAPEDERQVSFIDELKNSSALQAGADFIIAPLEDLKFAIEDKLLKPVPEVVEPEVMDEDGSTVADDGPPLVYLICDIKDTENTVELEDYLFDQGFDVLIPAFEGDQSELRVDHQENLKNCDAVIIYYGEGNDLWIRSKTRDLMKIAGYGRKKPLDVKAVYLAGPETRQKSRFRSHDLHVVNGLSAFDPTQMTELVEQIKKTKAG